MRDRPDSTPLLAGIAIPTLVIVGEADSISPLAEARAMAAALPAGQLAVIDGAGTLTTGGKMVETKKDGKVVSRAIEGGVSQKVAKGDFVMIPEGVPHYITEANPHVIFIAIEFPRPRSAYPDRR